jgi:hypothetical protein
VRRSPKSGSRRWAGHGLDEKITKHYAPLIAAALAKSITGLRDIVETRAIHRDATKAADPTEVEAATAAIRARAVLDRQQLADVLNELYADGWLSGSYSAADAVGITATIPAPIGELVTDIDWSKWAPGNPAAALKDASGGLRQLLEQADTTIRGLLDSEIDRLGDILAQGLSAGDSVDTIASALNDDLDDPARSELIARTETARAMSQASLDTYVASGVHEVDLKTFAACQVCEDIASDNPYPVSSPPSCPVHPNCRCALLPVIDTGEEDEEAA